MRNFQGNALDEHKYIEGFSNLRYCTFNETYLDILEFQQQQQKRISTKTYFSKSILEIAHGTREKRRDYSLNLNFKRKFNRNYQIKLFNYKRYIVHTF